MNEDPSNKHNYLNWKFSSSQKALLLFQENLNWDAKKKTLPDGSHSYSLFIICVIIFISYSYKHDEFM